MFQRVKREFKPGVALWHRFILMNGCPPVRARLIFLSCTELVWFEQLTFTLYPLIWMSDNGMMYQATLSADTSHHKDLMDRICI
ncbi:hypothetical protein Lmor_3131 [Legionella moravica]|uniref:Uncharacterized protein n=1 Tax=Legionella moravica TaxID=39962 RepID=A0A378K1N4_9GAMM|nr:hypothetical protein Lmor_3131 [Legionella moravica]STX63602.1 Uncharacterised protein [Legionella moravica]